MPIGLAVLGWTNREGFFIIAKYPEFELNAEDAMHIGSTHRMRNLKANTIRMNLKNYNVASFFTGTYTQNYYMVQNVTIALILSKDEDTQQYIKKIPIAAKTILNGLGGINLIDYSDRTVNIERVLASIQGNESYKEALSQVFGALSFGTIQENEAELLSIIPPEEEEEVDLDILQMDLDGKQQGLELAQQAMGNLKFEIDKLNTEITRLKEENLQKQQVIDNFQQTSDNINSKMGELKTRVINLIEEFKTSFLENVNDKKITLLLQARMKNFSNKLDEILKSKTYQILFIGNPEVGKKSLLGLLSQSEYINEVEQEVDLLGVKALITACKFEDIGSTEDIEPYDLIVIVTDSKVRDVMQCGSFYNQVQGTSIPICLIANKQDEPGASKIPAIQQIVQLPICPAIAIEQSERLNLSNFISEQIK